MTQRSITQLISEVVNFTNETELVGEGEEASRKLFSRFEAVLGRERQKLLTPALVLELGSQLASLVEFVDTLDAKVAVVQVYDDDETTRKKRLRKRCASMANKLRKIIVDDFAHTVRWIERDEPNDRGHSRGILLCTGPLDVSEFLANAIWAYTTPVLMSATLAITDFKTGRTDFGFMAKEQGLDLTGNYKTFVGPTPFDFRTQARTYIPEHMPSLRDTPESWRSQFVFENQELIRAADGRSMLLFTSWRELNECYKLLAPYIQGELGHQVFKQGDMGSTRKLAQAFTDDEHSVLFGTKSFFTGVNVEGDSLRYLGIAKLPFHYPDPLWQARIDAINAPVPDHQRGFKGAFPNLQLPDMIMTLIQGYGRLIRTVSDRGLVAIFDPSITLSTGKSYGKNKVRPALPPAPILTDLRPAVDYLLSLDAPLTV
jgi:ATP-dependent DNA helicase DinG